MTASYTVSVRQASVLPAASFRFHLTADTLAVQLTIPLTGFVGDFHSQVGAPCRAHHIKAESFSLSAACNPAPDTFFEPILILRYVFE